METTSKPIKIGMIGSDSTHTIHFARQFEQREDIVLQWIDINNYSELPFSVNRSPKIRDELIDLDTKFVNGFLNQAEVDAYCIMTCDANNHREILDLLDNKPVFIDKPMFNNSKYFNNLNRNYLSSSALRYCTFVQKARMEVVKNKPKIINIEGPLSFIDGIDGYFWYGIHLIEMASTLTSDSLEVVSVEEFEEYEDLIIKSNDILIKIKAIKVGDPEFKIHFDHFTFSIKDDNEMIYDNLIDNVVEFFRNPTPLGSELNVIKTIEKINEMKER